MINITGLGWSSKVFFSPFSKFPFTCNNNPWSKRSFVRSIFLTWLFLCPLILRSGIFLQPIIFLRLRWLLYFVWTTFSFMPHPSTGKAKRMNAFVLNHLSNPTNSNSFNYRFIKIYLNTESCKLPLSFKRSESVHFKDWTNGSTDIPEDWLFVIFYG